MCHDNIPQTGRIDPCYSCCLHQILTIPFEYCSWDQDLSNQALIYQALTCLILVSVWTGPWVFCSYLTEETPVLFFCCCGQSASRFNMPTCFQWSFLHVLVLTRKLFKLLLLFYLLDPVCQLSSDSKKSIFIHTPPFSSSSFSTTACKSAKMVNIPEILRPVFLEPENTLKVT